MNANSDRRHVNYTTLPLHDSEERLCTFLFAPEKGKFPSVFQV